MGRKVFISFLGFTNYESIRYARDDNDSASAIPLRFIQEATLLKIKEQFGKNDKILILTTKGALKNWHDGEHQNFKSNNLEWHEGLNSRLGKLNLLADYQNIDIKDGQDTDEIWSIFNVIFNLLEEYDELYFDITHGFRTLPMLNMVLINYAKLLKSITVNGIFYGAYEAKKTVNNIEYAPIWNLKSFVDLQDWTNSANIFLKTGNAIELATRINDDNYNSLKESLTLYSKQLLVNRGLDIYDGEITLKLKNQLQDIEKNSSTSPALTPILQKIKNEFTHYEKDNALNGFLAVRWCINNGLIQQAATLLEEFIITFVMTEIGEADSLTDYDKRTTVGSTLAIGKDKPFNFQKIPLQEEDADLCKIEAILNFHDWQNRVVPVIKNLPYQKDILKILNNLKNPIRNDINHAGFRERARDFDSLEDSIKSRYKETQKLIQKMKNIDLPNL
jgi:CRISPR-associated Csx2 family protein